MAVVEFVWAVAVSTGMSSARPKPEVVLESACNVSVITITKVQFGTGTSVPICLCDNDRASLVGGASAIQLRTAHESALALPRGDACCPATAHPLKCKTKSIAESAAFPDVSSTAPTLPDSTPVRRRVVL